MSFQRNAFKKCFNKNELLKNENIYIKTNRHIRNRKTNFNQTADFICGIKIIDCFAFLLTTKEHLKIITQNGSKYDLRFLLYLIPRMGGILEDKKITDEYKKIINNHQQQIINIGNFTYNYLCDDKNKLYFLEITTEQNKKILFFDDYLITKASLKIKGELLGLEKLENENEYQVFQPFLNLQAYLSNKNELSYLTRDCDITLFFFKKFFLSFISQEGSMCFGITASSIAFKT